MLQYFPFESVIYTEDLAFLVFVGKLFPLAKTTQEPSRFDMLFLVLGPFLGGGGQALYMRPVHSEAG